MDRHAFTAAERKAVKAKTSGYCAKCGVNPIGEIHHIRPVVDGGANDLQNLTGLCSPCHREWHHVMSGLLPFSDWIKYPPAAILIQSLAAYDDQPNLNLSVQEWLDSIKRVAAFARQSKQQPTD